MDKVIDNVYVDYLHKKIIISKKTKDGSYQFFETSYEDVELKHLVLIPDIFSYIEENNLDISKISKIKER